MAIDVAKPTSGYLTVDQVAARFEMSPTKLYQLIGAGRIPHRRLPFGRRILFQADWLDEWMNGCELETIKLAGGGRVVRPRSEAKDA